MTHLTIPWRFVAVGLAVVGYSAVVFGVGFVSGKRQSMALSEMRVLVATVQNLDEKVTQTAAQRCMTIQTPVLNIDVWSAPSNVGVKPVPAPPGFGKLSAPKKEPLKVSRAEDDVAPAVLP